MGAPLKSISEAGPATAETSRLTIHYRENTGELRVSTRTVSVQIMRDKKARDQKVFVHGANDVYLYSSMGIHIREEHHVEFRLEFVSNVTVQVSPDQSGATYFQYGDALFCLDRKNKAVKVWAPWFWFDFSSGFIGIGRVEPRPALAEWKGHPVKALPC